MWALGVWAAVATTASAGWDNVFQPTLFERFHNRQTTTAQYVPPVVVAQSSPCGDPCEQKRCTTNYVQRCYYQPVTVYQSKTVMEPVTTMQTSYYYAPVTTYRYSCYYDPCTCSYQQVAIPQCGYELRAKQCPVQSWVSRCVQVPVQAYQRVDYWQPVTTCCTTTVGAPIGAAPIGNAPPAVVPMPPAQTPSPDLPPSIRGDSSKGAALPKQPMWNQFYPPIEKTDGGTPGMSFPKLGLPEAVKPAPQPPVKLNQIAVGPDSRVEGQVVRSDSSPKPNAKVLFVNASSGMRQTVNANTAGRFQVDLPAGSWHVYLHGADDLPIYQNRIDVNDAQTRSVKLVSRSN
jgi:hypothetical protein